MAKKAARTVHSPRFPVESRMIPLRDLLYDDTNPRIVERLGGKSSQSEIESILLGADIKAQELVSSFIENGYLPYEPLVVRRNKTKFIVVEGNRRLAALRLMQRSDDEETKAAFHHHHLEQVPSLVFIGDDKAILAYLGLRHLSKTKDWSSSAKGAFVERILNAHYSLNEAAKLTNTTSQALRLILLTRRLFERAANLGLVSPAREGDGETYFWRLGDAIRRTKTKAYLELMENPDPLQQPEVNETKFDYLISWIYGNSRSGQAPILTSIRDTKRLDECLGHARAAQALENGGTLDEAIEELQSAGSSILGHLDRAKKSIERANGGAFSELDLQGLEGVENAVSGVSNALVSTSALVTEWKRKRARQQQ
jgi:ParB-like nuclease domain